MAKASSVKDYLIKAENDFLAAVTKELKKKYGSKLKFRNASRVSRTDIIAFEGVNSSDVEVEGYYSLIIVGDDRVIFNLSYKDAMYGRASDDQSDLRGNPREITVDRVVNHFGGFYS